MCWPSPSVIATGLVARRNCIPFFTKYAAQAGLVNPSSCVSAWGQVELLQLPALHYCYRISWELQARSVMHWPSPSVIATGLVERRNCIPFSTKYTAQAGLVNRSSCISAQGQDRVAPASCITTETASVNPQALWWVNPVERRQHTQFTMLWTDFCGTVFVQGLGLSSSLKTAQFTMLWTDSCGTIFVDVLGLSSSFNLFFTLSFFMRWSVSKLWQQSISPLGVSLLALWYSSQIKLLKCYLHVASTFPCKWTKEPVDSVWLD